MLEPLNVSPEDLQADIDSMLDSFVGPNAASASEPGEPIIQPAPQPGPDPTPEIVPEPVVPEPQSEPAPVVPEPEPETVPEPAPEPVVPLTPQEEEILALKERNEALLELYNKAGTVPVISPLPGPVAPITPEPIAAVLKPAPEPSGPIDFVKDDNEFQEALTTREGFNKLLTNVYARGVSDATAGLDNTINQTVNNSFNVYTKSKDFYTANEDLKPYRRAIGQIANELLQNHPEWNDGVFDNLFAALPEASRKALRMAQVPVAAAPSVTPPVNGKPVLPRPSGSRGAGPVQLTGLQREMQIMSDAVL